MRNKRFVKHTSRAFAILMSAMMAVGIAMPVNAAGKKDSKKEDKTETVYVNANADGSVDKITVSDWLKNHSSSDTLEDFSNLENIKNVKGDETFTQNADGSIVWDSKGNDIYYQGESNEELPVTMKVTYYLDGQQMDPKDMAGKSGEVKIRFDYYNNSNETVKVKGKNYNVKTPFTMVTGMILSSDVFSNIEVTNGKVISDGDKNVVVGLAFPGLKSSLNLASYDKLDDNQTVKLTYTDSTGTQQTVTAITKSVAADTKYNEHLHPGADEVYFVPETGELVFGDDVYDSIRAGKDLSVDYKKTEFAAKDVRPEHYFNCTAVDNTTGEVSNYRTAGTQNMMYQINFSQTLVVNTEGCDSINLAVGRTISDITNICNDLDVMEANLKSVEKRINDCDENDKTTLANLNELKSQIETEIQLQKTVLGKALGSAITTCQSAKDELNVALADHGSRYNRMSMTKSKLEQQQIDTKEAKSDNEDADLGEAYVNFSEADLLYQATLNATSKILGQSLLNFI